MKARAKCILLIEVSSVFVCAGPQGTNSAVGRNHSVLLINDVTHGSSQVLSVKLAWSSPALRPVVPEQCQVSSISEGSMQRALWCDLMLQ